jgi:hypothetical protein
MSQYLTRNPGQSRKSNTQGPGSSSGGPEPVQFFENSYSQGTVGVPYTVAGQQEWIFLPDDTFPTGVTVSGSGSWSAYVLTTDSPPDQVLAGSAITYQWPSGTVTSTTSATIQGATAICVYVVLPGTNVKISVRS